MQPQIQRSNAICSAQSEAQLVRADLTKALGAPRMTFVPGWSTSKEALRDIAIILEAVLAAALAISSRRAVPQHLEQIVANAIAVQSDSHTLEDKVRASLRNLRLETEADADDALSVFDSLCSARGDGRWLRRSMRSSARAA